MSYRCECCGHSSPKKAPRLTHIVYRENGQISREIAVCRTCYHQLEQGKKIDDLIIGFSPPKPIPPEPPKLSKKVLDRWSQKAQGDFVRPTPKRSNGL